jgi:ubiquinone/menaquinone biosynthesis C-methylase UbiE
MNRFLRKEMRRKTAALEIGAGTGALLEDMHDRDYIGIDHSFSSLAKLKKSNPTVIALCTSGINIPFNSEVFETVVSLHTLEHIYSIAEHLEEVKRVMLTGGR